MWNVLKVDRSPPLRDDPGRLVYLLGGQCVAVVILRC